MVCIRCKKRPAVKIFHPADGEQPDEAGGLLPALRPGAAYQAGGTIVDEAVRIVGAGLLDNMEDRMESMMEELGYANPLSMMMTWACPDRTRTAGG